MIFKVLGSSGSELGRFHPCSFLIDSSVLVDMGSAASRLTLQEQGAITDILLSHPHLDHSKDLAFFSENVFAVFQNPVTVHGTAGTIEAIRAHLFNNRIWPDFTSLPSQAKPILRYEVFEPGRPFHVGGVEVHAVPVNHLGGCVAMFFKGPKGTVLYTGDTGPTDAVWKEANRRGNEIVAILLECSLPNRMADVARKSGHHTSETLSREIGKISGNEVSIFIYHLKAPYEQEILTELRKIDDPRLRMLEPGMTMEF
ncbi:MAG: 3',5'-cyclic-nucleotide phosphodiesterase [Pseudomonadota bacterium]